MPGAAVVGRLIVDLAADVAQLKADMSTATGVVEAGGAAMERAASIAKTALIGMAAALGPAALAQMVSTTVEATAALDNMAARTGVSVESLSALRSIANVVGADFDTVGQGATKLAKAMYEAAANGGKTAEAFNLIGVEIKNAEGTLRATDEVLLDVAKSFAAMEDGATKTALAQILLGKSGAQLIEVLNELGKAGEYQVRITAQQAAQAEELERDWARIGAAGREMRTIVINEMVPALDALAQSWLDFINEGGGFRDAIKQWAADGTFAEWFRYAGLQVAKLADALVDFKNLFVAWGETIASAMGLLKGVWDQLAGGAAILAGQWQQGMALIRQGSELNKEALYGLADAWGKNTEFSTKFQDAYTKNLILIDTTTTAVRNQAPVIEDTAAKNKAWTDALKEWNAQADAMDKALYSWNKLEAAERIKEAAAATKEWTEQADAMQRALYAWNKLTEQAVEHGRAFSQSLRDQVQASNDEVASFGLSAEALRDLNTVREMDRKTRQLVEELRKQGLENLAAEKEGENEAAKAAILANNARLDGLRSWQALLTDVTSAASDFIVDFVNNGSDAFKRLWQRFRDWALEALAEIAAKQIVVSIVGALGLGGAGGALAAGGITEGGAASTLLSALGLAGNSGGGIGGSLLSALGLGGGGEWAPGSTGLLELVPGGGLGGLAGLLPYAGIAALALPLLGGLFGSKGGPMDRQYGLSGGGLGDFGDFSGLHKLVGTDAAQTGGMNTLAGGINADYLRYVAMLGGTPGAAAFSVYSSMDPKGTAPSNVDVRATLGGTEVYRGDNFNVGRSQAEVDAALRDQAAQAILAALKASNVSDLVKAFLGEVQVTADTIDAVVQAAAVMMKLPEDLQTAFVDAIKIDPSMLEKLSAFNAAFVDLQAGLDAGDKLIADFASGILGVADASDTTYGKAALLLESLQGLSDAYDGSTEQTAALAKGTDAYVQALGAALLEIQQIRTGLATMFGDSIANIKLAALTEAQRADFLKREALNNIELLKQTTDPRQIEKLSKIVNDDLMKVFNMLSPEEQRRQQQWFIDRLTEAGNLADAQLIASGNALLGEQEDGRTILATIRDQLTAAARIQYEAAVALGKAAGTFSGSVEDFDAIAKKPVQVSVTVTQKKTTTPEPAPYNPGYSTGLEPYDPNQMYAIGDPRLGVVTP